MSRLTKSLLALLLFNASVALAEEERPNVLFIAIDDLNGWIGALDGHPQVETPHIDRLARRGVLFTNAHCAAPACNPSRTAVMTGKAPASSGVYLNKQDWRETTTLKDVATIPEYFRREGYEVLGGGKLYHAASLSEKSHTGLLDPEPWDEYFPSKERQLVAEALPARVPTHGTTEFYKGFFDWADLEIDDAEMGDAKVVAWAEKHLSRKRARPLFLGVGIYRPHIPWYTPRRYFDLYPEGGNLIMPKAPENDLDDIPIAGQNIARRHWHLWMRDNEQWRPYVRAYLASVSFADAMVGRLLDALDAGPLAGNTVIVLWSDHGYHLGHKEHWEKFALWEQATRVPLIFAAPGVEGDATCASPVSLLDIFPTLVELTEAGTPSTGFDGESLGPLLKSPGRKTGRAVVTTQGFGNHAIRSDRWRYIRYEDGSEELYDHADDPGEFTNLAGDPRFEEIRTRLARWLPKVNLDPDPPLEAK